MTTLRWGVLSTANIARGALIPAIHASSGSELRAVASRDEARARAFADENGIPVAYGSYEDLLANPEIDAIYNPLPNHLHVPWTIKAMEAGKHVLCEKPISLDIVDLEPLLEAHERMPDIVVMEAFMYRFHPRWIAAKRLIREEAIGTVTDIDVAFSYFNRDADDVRNNPEIGGGGLMDIGCYCISTARFLYGTEPWRGVASLEIDPEFGTDKIAHGILDFGEARRSHFFCSTQAAGFQQVRVVGERGVMVLDWPFNAPTDVPTTIQLTVDGESRAIEFAPTDQYVHEVEAFAKAVRAGGPAPTPLSDAAANMTVIDAMFASASSDAWVPIA